MACRDGVDLVSRWVLRARERGVSNPLLGDQRVYGRLDRIGLDSAALFCLRLFKTVLFGFTPVR